MQLIRGLHNLRQLTHGCVATIGNFDGVHRGHQAIFQQVAEQGKRLGLPVVVIFFEPQPDEFFASGRAEPRITRLREKLALLAKLPLDFVFCLRFDRQLASMSPDEFVRQVLVEGIGVRYLVVGPDFRFGYQRKGDYQFLRDQGNQHGFSVVAVERYDVGGERVSSTRVRRAITRGDFAEAAQLLGRRYTIAGQVATGGQIGRTIGFPTANIGVLDRAICLSGVYAVRVTGAGVSGHQAVANIGTRPTVDSQRKVLEVHLLDFNGDLYGQRLQIEFCYWLRDEQKFPSLDALKAQIVDDEKRARQWFIDNPALIDNSAPGIDSQR